MDKRPKTAVLGIAVVAIAAAALWWTLRGGVAPPVGAVDAPQHDAALLIVSETQAQNLGFKFFTALQASEAPIAELPAIIVPPPGARVAVAATLPGVVMRTLVVEGDSVHQGQPLAVIASRDVLRLSADLARADARLGVAQSNANRLAQLAREGVIAGSRADAAGAVAAEARADVSENTRLLRLVNGDGRGGTYTLLAPIGGRITTADIQVGSPVDGSTAPYVIDAVDRLQIEAQLPERFAGVARRGMTVRLGDVRGTVTAVGSTIDPATRSVMLKASLPAGSPVVAGRATSVSLFGPAKDGEVSVPSAAVTRIDDHDVVFVVALGGYAVRKVAVGGSSVGMTLLLTGVAPGERVVAAGTSALKSLAQAR